jgi:GTP-binding protein
MLDLLDQSAVSYQVILTKHDELTAAERNRVVEATITALAKRPAAYPEIIFTSSQSGEGIAALRESVARLLHEIGA